MEDYEDYFECSDEEDIICSSKYISSDEDEDILSFLPKAESTSMKAACVVSGKRAADDHDDFEKEMASELSMTVQHLAASFIKNKSQSSSSASPTKREDDKQKTLKEDSEFYDDVYFDSDESETEGGEAASQPSRPKSQKAGRRVMTNDELLYDPTLDDKDQEWVNKQRRLYQVKQRRGLKGAGSVQGGKSGSVPPLPPSDAVLNCPACLTKLCMDCQRHSIYHNQYRAMFVFNCVVDMMESLKFPSKNQKKKDFFRNKKMKVKQAQEGSAGEVDKTPQESQESVASPSVAGLEASTSARENDDELYHPVTCKICNTKVAVYDKNEVYHFFNVVTSY